MRRPGLKPIFVVQRVVQRAASRVIRPVAGLAGLTLLVGLSACGSPCDQLRDFVCDGGDAEYCAKVDEFLAEQQVDADGKPLDEAARQESCRYIMGNVELQNAYRFKAKQRYKGEPYFQVLKNMKPDERKAWREKHGIPEPEEKVDEAKSGDAKADAKAR